MEEAVSGVKGELAVKLYGDNLRTLEHTAELIQAQMATVQGIEDLGIFRIVGQPNLNFTVDREAAARWGINVADIQDALQTAIGSNAVTQVQQGEARYDVTLRYQKQYRDTREAIEDVRLLAPSGERVSLAQLTKVATDDGAEQINREGGQRYIAIKYSVRGRDLGSTVEEAISRVERNVTLPSGYHLEWAGEYASQKRADKRMALVIPITVLDDLPHSLHHVPFVQVVCARAGVCHHGLHRRPAGAFSHAHQLFRFLRGRIPGALWGLGGDRRHHDRVHQPIARSSEGVGGIQQGTHH